MSNKGYASMFSRWTLGLFSGMLGFYKVFTITPHLHAQNFFVNGFKDNWIPEALLWGLGYSIPFIELIVGILIFTGFFVRHATISLGYLLVIIAYGHLLQDAFYDPTIHFAPRFALMILILLLYSEEDRYSAENFLKHIKKSDG